MEIYARTEEFSYGLDKAVEVVQEGDHFEITKDGKRVAVLVGWDQWERLQGQLTDLEYEILERNERD